MGKWLPLFACLQLVQALVATRPRAGIQVVARELQLGGMAKVSERTSLLRRDESSGGVRVQ